MLCSSVKANIEIIRGLRTKRIPCILLLLSILLLSACAGQTEEPPGIGEKAERGYAACNFIIEVLEYYKRDTGTYPASLVELVPDYSPSIPTEVNGQPIMYHKTDEGYSLSFSYIGPGMNSCTYSTDDGRQWRCSGAH